MSNEYLTADVKSRNNDIYANTKYTIIGEMLESKAKLKILDVGCGSGELALYLAKKGHQVIGIDRESEYISMALRNANNDAVTIQFHAISIENYQPDEQFDIVVSTDVLEHIQDDRKAFDKICSFSKPGGEIIIAVPAMQWLYGYHDQAIGHFRRYSKSALIDLITPTCTIQSIRYFGWVFIPLSLLYGKLLKKPYPLSNSGDANKNPIIATILKVIAKMDKKVELPFGTSIIVKATKTHK
jgi:2-polyprenyl-3-methyl-5-hydroxy-6-metoxy-1,4-benzoquinol methylase